MRVASKTIYDMIKYNLSGITEEMNKANEVASSGKLISKLSDDPVGLTQALKINSTLSGIGQLTSNITLGNSWLTASESALDEVQDIISDIKSLSVEMSSSTVGESERASAAEEVQNMLDEVISLANTEIAGRYVFSGSITDAVPFDSAGSYSGDSNPFAIKIGQDTTITISKDGEAVFGALITTLSTLKDDLLNNNVDGIQESIDSLTANSEDMSSVISDIGSKLNRLEIRQNILDDLELSNTDRLSTIEDADTAEAVINVEAIQVAYEAALTSSSKVLELSLVDYLK